jgi:hypothetical protein
MTGIAIGLGVGPFGGGVKTQPFSPLDLSPALWLDASDTATITASLGSVSQWDDKSGNARHVTQGTAAAQPTTGTQTINGLNVIDFDGGDQLRSAAGAVTEVRANKALTQFLVFKSDRTNTASEGIVSAQTTGFDYQSGWIQERRTTNLAFTIAEGPDYNAASFSDSATTPQVFVVQASASANTKGAWIGTTSKTLTTFDGLMATSDFMGGTGNHQINIGSRGSISAPFDGWIAEVIIYASALSDDDRVEVTDYLIDKWGL